VSRGISRLVVVEHHVLSRLVSEYHLLMIVGWMPARYWAPGWTLLIQSCTKVIWMDATRNRTASLILIVAVLVPCLPATLGFLRSGVPDILSTGDAATLELATLHASRGAQFVGPYSRFGWNHPGPLMFYLATPIYVAFGRNGPALNIFALLANATIMIAIVLSAWKLRGFTFAFLVAALLSVYILVAVPHLPTNEWNPVLPILPLVLLSLISVRMALGAVHLLPVFVFVASAVAQTHIGFIPEVAALCIYITFSIRKRSLGTPASFIARQHWERVKRLTFAVLVVCWALPLSEAAFNHGGNIWQLLAFWEPKHFGQHRWAIAIATVLRGMGYLPLALARTAHVPVSVVPDFALMSVGIAQTLLLIWILRVSRRQRDEVAIVFATTVLIQIAVAVIAVRAIRGEIYDYLVIWTSALGLTASAAMAAHLIKAVESNRDRPIGRVTVLIASAILIGSAVAEPVPRGPVFRSADVSTERLAFAVNTYLLANHVRAPLISIASHDTWPTAVAVTLYLDKRDYPVTVAPEWLFMVGRSLTPRGNEDVMLVFGDESFYPQSQNHHELKLVANEGRVYVYAETIASAFNH
jgi:hypothetical protein